MFKKNKKQIQQTEEENIEVKFLEYEVCKAMKNTNNIVNREIRDLSEGIRNRIIKELNTQLEMIVKEPHEYSLETLLISATFKNSRYVKKQHLEWKEVEKEVNKAINEIKENGYDVNKKIDNFNNVKLQIELKKTSYIDEERRKELAKLKNVIWLKRDIDQKK